MTERGVWVPDPIARADFAAFADLKRASGAGGQAAPHAPRKGGRTPVLD